MAKIRYHLILAIFLMIPLNIPIDQSHQSDTMYATIPMIMSQQLNTAKGPL